jgi:hypothetical protein
MNSTIEINSTIAWTVQQHEQYNNINSTIEMNSTIDMNSTIEMNSTMAWTAQLHEQYKNMDSTIVWTVQSHAHDCWCVCVAKLFNCLCCVLFCWIYSWILFPNAWINHNLKAFRWVFFSFICQLHFYKYISYYTINFQKIIHKSILYPALIIRK